MWWTRRYGATAQDGVRTRPWLVTFSGIDGSGKSTNIALLRASLTSAGLRVRSATFWDDVVVFPRLRENLTHKLFRGEMGVGSPERPVQRRDKNLRPWHVTLARCGLYVLDAIHLRRLVKQLLSSESDVVIFDRYLYDQLAVLPMEQKVVRIYARLLCRLVPRPDIAYLLDANPEAAFIRKPEYPLEFLKQYRRSYLLVRKLMGGITLIHALPLEKTSCRVVEEFKRVSVCPAERTSAISNALGHSPTA